MGIVPQSPSGDAVFEARAGANRGGDGQWFDASGWYPSVG